MQRFGAVDFEPLLDHPRRGGTDLVLRFQVDTLHFEAAIAAYERRLEETA